MVAFNSVGRLRHPSDPRALQAELVTAINNDLAIRLLPKLLDITLPIRSASGRPIQLDDQLARRSYITLAGWPGSGRRLAFLQLTQRWATSSTPRSPAPMPIALPQLDDDRSPPEALLSAWIDPHGGLPDQRTRRRSLSLLRLGTPAAPEPQPPRWQLLLFDLDELPAERRAIWRDTLLAAPKRWPFLQIAIAVPHGEAEWPGFSPLTISAPTPDLLQRWIEQIAPAEQHSNLLQLIGPGGTLHTLAERMFDIGLLAWLVSRDDIPSTRAELYRQAILQILSLAPPNISPERTLNQLQLLAAYGEAPSVAIETLIEPKEDQAPRFTYPQVRRYMAARQLVEEHRYDLLHALDPLERNEIALMLASMIGTPTPLYQALWRGGRPHPADVLTLGRCLREQRSADSGWALRIAGALARLTHAGAPEQRAEAHSVLATIIPQIDTALAALTGAGATMQPIMLRLLDTLPRELAEPRIELLAYNSATPEDFAWSLVDRLNETIASDIPPAPAERLALARWAYLQATRSPHSRQRLAASAIPALTALAESGAGQARCQRAANALLDDAQMPIGAQIAALQLVGAHAHPAAASIIERAIHDGDTLIRRSAITALATQDASHASAILSRTLFNASAHWDARIEAIHLLGELRAPGDGALLEHCASDTNLPLYVRTQAAIALGRSPDGLNHLLGIMTSSRYHLEVRIAATRQLGRSGHYAALNDLLGMLEDPATPAPIAEAICDALGTIGALYGPDPRACDTLLITIASNTDVSITQAAVRALGRLGDSSAIAPLSQLLGAEAFARLAQAPYQDMIPLPVDICLASQTLPQTLALRLESAYAEGATPADRPTTLAEFLVSEADLLQASAAASLVAIGGASARDAILDTLLNGSSGGATDELIAILAATAPEHGADTIGYLIVSAEGNPLTRWLAIRHLAEHPDGEPVMRHLLSQASIDTFTRGALAEALGQRGDPAVIPLLVSIADDTSNDSHLRTQALLALGALDQPEIEPALMRLASDNDTDDTLRGLAVEYLPSRLSEHNRRKLRDMLRRERVPTPIVIGALRTLQRTHDHEALPLMLRYAQDEIAEIAQAAIGALAALGDPSVTPDLVRISQNPNVDRAVRLEAIGALLRLGGSEFQSLLRNYLEQGSLPLRLQAIEHLIAAGHTTADLLPLLADTSWPLLLRLRIIDRIGSDPQTQATLVQILRDPSDDSHLRCLAAEMLGRSHQPSALPELIALANQNSTPASIRLRCINAIGAIGTAAAWLALSSLAESSQSTPIMQHWALLAIRQLHSTSQFASADAVAAVA